MQHIYFQSLEQFIVSADRRAQFEKLEYTDEDYQKELEHIEKVKQSMSFHLWLFLLFAFLLLLWTFHSPGQAYMSQY